jgi:hypothetical protein
LKRMSIQNHYGAGAGMDHQKATTNLAVERYLLGELTEQERHEFEEHYFTCVECAEAVQTGTLLTVNGKAVAREQSRFPSRPERVTEIRPRSGVPKPRWWGNLAAAAAAVLLVITGYQNMVTIPHLRSPQAVSRMLLHAKQRNDDVPPMLKESRDVEPVVSLEVTGKDPRASYDVDVVRAGQTLYRIPSAPVQDGTVDVTVPSAFEAGAYEMLLRVPTDGSEAGRYSFQLER